MKIYDCFTFYNECELLLWRLKILWDIVDHFVIVEGNKTFQNKPKAFNFQANRKMFAPYEKKIRYLPISEEMPYDSDWSIEIYQRNAIGRALDDCQPDDVILLSDVDEIPAPCVLHDVKNDTGEIRLFAPFDHVGERSGLRGFSRNLRCLSKVFPHARHKNNLHSFLQRSPVVCEQAMYNFFINYQQRSNWCGTILVTHAQIQTMQDLRSRRNLYPLVRGGWHFTSLGGVQMIRKKIQSTSDGKQNPIYHLPREKQEEVIERALADGLIWWSGERLQKRALEELDVPYAAWFVEQYPHMFHV